MRELEALLKGIENYYKVNGHRVDVYIYTIINQLLKDDPKNIFAIADLWFAQEIVNDGLSRESVRKFVDLAIASHDGEKIVKCADLMGRKYKEFLEPLVDALIKTRDLGNIYRVAWSTYGISREQFTKLAKTIVNSKDIGGIIALSSHVSGYRLSGDGYDILNEYVDFILQKHDNKLVKNIIDKIEERHEATRGRPGYAIPIGRAVSTEELKFQRTLKEAWELKKIEIVNKKSKVQAPTVDEARLKVLQEYYYAKRGEYTSTLKRTVDKLLKENKENFFVLLKEPYARDMVDSLSKVTFKKFVDLTIYSNDSEKIYDCAHAIGKKHIDQMDDLVMAMLDTNDIVNIYSMAVNVNGINKEQRLCLAKSIVDAKEVEGIVLISSYLFKAVNNRYDENIENQFTKYIINKNDNKLIDDIMDNIKEKKDFSARTPRYGIPFGKGVTDGQLRLKDSLYYARKFIAAEDEIQ